MQYDPYLVVGTGRSGTSTVAGILHNKMNVFMGYEFPPTNHTNPDGFWEDIEFYRTNKLFTLGKIDYPTWKEEIAGIIVERKKLDKPWGLKDSRMADLLGLYLAFLKNPKIIRCKREKELVISSLIRCYGHSEEHATAFWNVRENMIDNILSGKDFLTVHFGVDRIADGEIIDLIENKWGKNDYEI